MSLPSVRPSQSGPIFPSTTSLPPPLCPEHRAKHPCSPLKRQRTVSGRQVVTNGRRFHQLHMMTTQPRQMCYHSYICFLYCKFSTVCYFLCEVSIDCPLVLEVGSPPSLLYLRFLLFTPIKELSVRFFLFQIDVLRIAGVVCCTLL